MPVWMIAHRVCYARAIGVIWQKRGLNVLPGIRWRNLSDLEHILAGVQVGSPICVSNYGFRRDKAEARLFVEGLEIVINRLQPQFLVLYGSTNDAIEKVINQVEKVTILPSKELRTNSPVKIHAEGKVHQLPLF